MNQSCKCNYYGLFLDKLYDDKEIQKNKAIVTEKLCQIIMISLFGFIGTVIFFFYQIQQNHAHPAEVLEISIVKMQCIFIWWKSTNIMDKLGKANRGLKIVDDLFNLQVQLVFFFTVFNFQIIQEVTFVDVSDLQVVFMAIGNVFLLCVVISNTMKIWICVLMEIWLIDFTFFHFHHGTFGVVYLFSLHGQIILNILFIYVQQVVLVASWEEYKERVDVSFHTMHDLRNQLYSQIELNNDPEDDDEEEAQEEVEVPQTKPLTYIVPNRQHTTNDNNPQIPLRKSISKKGSKTNQSRKGSKMDNQSRKGSKMDNQSKKSSKVDFDLETQNKKGSKVDFETVQNLAYDESLQVKQHQGQSVEVGKVNKIKQQGSVLMLNEDIKRDSKSNKLTEEEKEEKSKQQRFILFKVCFLQHLELMFDNSYNLNPRITDVRELCHTSSETMKVLFQNKNNNISMELISMVQAIDLDPTIFEQLICDIAKFFHDSKQDDIKFICFAMFKNMDVQFHIQVEVKDLDPTTINHILGKHIIRKLIMTLNQNVTFKVGQDFNRVKFMIVFPQPKEVIASIMRKNRKNRHQSQGGSSSQGSKSKQSGMSDNSRNSNAYHEANLTSGFKSVAESDLNESDTSFSFHQTNLSKISTKKFVYHETIIIKRKLNEDVNSEIGNLIKKEDKIHNVNFEPVPENDKTEVDSNVRNRTTSGEFIVNVKVEEKITEEIADKFEITDIEDNKVVEEENNLTPLQALLKDQREVTQEECDGIIFINVDDENNILKMNKRIFTKEGLPLNGVTNIDDFLNLLRQIQLNATKNLTVPSLLCVMDHMLDREQGQEAVSRAIEQNKLLHLEMKFVLLSSTEDKETLSIQEKLGVTKAVTKPLNKSKLKPVLDWFKQELEQ